MPKVRALLFLPPFTTRWVPIDSVLDTGASATCLHPLDAISRVGIPAGRLYARYWPRQEIRAGVGGEAGYFPASATYAFLHQDGRWQIVRGEIRVAQLTAANQRLESLLGWDLLEDLAIALDWRNRIVTLR